MIIRRACPAEAAELSALIFASKQSNGYDDAFMAQCAKELTLTAQDITDGLIWVAQGDHLMGCVTLEVDETTRHGQISSFFVDPAHKRRGVGQQLWNVVLAAAQERGLFRLRLDADPAAVAFYKAMGFVTIGKTPSGSIPGRFLPIMELQISAA
ncbi:MAG: GNAT family N-acetyltransferase [Sulfitobacter sp.]